MTYTDFGTNSGLVSPGLYTRDLVELINGSPHRSGTCLNARRNLAQRRLSRYVRQRILQLGDCALHGLYLGHMKVGGGFDHSCIGVVGCLVEPIQLLDRRLGRNRLGDLVVCLVPWLFLLSS